jgi:tetratricopeptide (TPR) repeat protein
VLTNDQVKRKQLIRAAEGYLDLMSVFDDRWPLDPANLETLTQRVFECLDQIPNPQSFTAHVLFLKGQALRHSKRFSEATDYFHQSLDVDPENLSALLAMAWCYKRLNKLELATVTMRRAVALDAESGIAHYNLACYLALGDSLLESCEHLSIALEIDPRFRELVRGETDFDSIRNTPEFQAALAINV